MIRPSEWSFSELLFDYLAISRYCSKIIFSFCKNSCKLEYCEQIKFLRIIFLKGKTIWFSFNLPIFQRFLQWTFYSIKLINFKVSKMNWVTMNYSNCTIDSLLYLHCEIKLYFANSKVYPTCKQLSKFQF